VGNRRTRCDRLGGAHRISHYALSRNPQHPEPVFFQESCARFVALRTIIHVVHDTIDFDDKSRGEATQTNDVGPDGVLPTKFRGVRPSRQLLPQKPLRN
jgi:hypothetical protein